MREVVFKQLSSLEARKKDIFLKEIFEKDGVLTKIQRRCFYYIKDIIHLDEENGVQKWLDSQGGETSLNKRHFHILKEHNDGCHEDKVICKIAGTFYAIVNNNVYTIGFLHSFKIVFNKAEAATS